MSYDISLKDRVTGETLTVDAPHFMIGGTYQIGGTTELWLNITYNYASYYYEATDGDPRFAHEGMPYHYSDGTTGPVEVEYGIRGLYGKTGAESIPMLQDMIDRIKAKYIDSDGNWITTKRKEVRYIDCDGKEVDVVTAFLRDLLCTKEEYEIEVNEGPDENYWKPTAGNAIKPLYKLMAMAQMRPDGIWDGASYFIAICLYI